MKILPCFLLLLFAGLLSFQSRARNCNDEYKDTSRHIINFVNFIRQSEPRDAAVTEDVLFQTVKEEVILLKKHNLPGTFLLQYDALINPRYQQLLKEELNPGSEVGAWWEITQPHVEAAGLQWRGRYSWDWHANVGFATGYTPEEREKLVDVYMDKFKSVFGKYPASVGSWFIDAHTLAYLYDKYHIVASCNCKDQIGTDGYTLWGGYWNQAYYPSRLNAYMPAQTTAMQIGVPVFRMLGSDPIYQYESGIGTGMSHVITLEPVYEKGGGDKSWVEWFLRSLSEEPCLSFAYAQAGQENSFTWKAIKPGLEMQVTIIDSLRRAGKVTVETLAESGTWFRDKFPVTPPTAVTAMHDYRNEEHKTVWYNSRFYRTNLYWEGPEFRFRDLHLFDEAYKSAYLDKAGTSTQCIYKTLPVLDGFSWSTEKDLAGIRIVQFDKSGKAAVVKSGAPAVKALPRNRLEVEWKDLRGNTFRFTFSEDHFDISCRPVSKGFKWALELHTAPGVVLPFRTIGQQQIEATADNFSYSLYCTKGHIEKGPQDKQYVFRLYPDNDILRIACTNGR